MDTSLEPAGPPAARGDDGHPGTGWHTRADPSPRRHLAATVASAAGPYGYTISLGGSIALANGRLGSPHLAGALLLMLGAVAAFVALGATAQGTLAPGAPLPTAPATLLGGAHVPSAGLALCAVWAVDHVAGGAFGWLLTGFAATAVYLLLCAAQPRRGPRAPQPLMIVFAHAGHWLVGLGYFSPVLALLGAGKLRDRRDDI